VFLALVSLAAHFRVRSITVTQRKLLQRIAGTTGRLMSRRTLNRHLAALERRHVINRIKRHRRARGGALQLRATNYSFGRFGVLWIKRLRQAAAFPLGRLAVPQMAQSRKSYLVPGVRGAVDKAPTARRPRRRTANREPR